MRAKRRVPYRGVALLAALFLAAAGVLAAQGPAPKTGRKDDAAGFKEFSDRVQDYVKLQKTVESSLPTLKSTDLPEMIVAHQQALARKIREARPNAKVGDIFTEAARGAFRHVIRSSFAGPQADKTRAAMQQGMPLADMHLEVNGIYPDKAPYTTLPPTVLAKLPQLPKEAAYRVVQRDLILMDVKSSMVVDIVHEILPPQR